MIIITFVCGACYLFLAIANLITFIIDTIHLASNYIWPHWYIVSTCLIAIELMANGILLFALAPKFVQHAAKYLFCCECIRNTKQLVDYRSDLSLDEGYDDETDVNGLDEPENDDLKQGFLENEQQQQINPTTL